MKTVYSKRLFLSVLASGALAAVAAIPAPALAQGAYPNKPVRLVLPFPAGGAIAPSSAPLAPSCPHSWASRCW